MRLVEARTAETTWGVVPAGAGLGTAQKGPKPVPATTCTIASTRGAPSQAGWYGGTGAVLSQSEKVRLRMARDPKAPSATTAVAQLTGRRNEARPASTEALTLGTSQGAAAAREDRLAVTAGGRKMATLKVTPEPVGACTDESIGGQEPSVAVADCDGVSRGVACCVFDGDAE